MVWQIASQLTRKLPAETAHIVGVKALRYGFYPKTAMPYLPVTLQGLSLPNPLGLAAGFDKNAECYQGAFALGFGHVEVGTITPLAQPGNPRPRVFRLSEDEGVINRYGFNGKGMSYAACQLRKGKKPPHCVLGVNIGANKLSEDKAADYESAAQALSAYADYLTVNISSPNTPGLRDLQDAKGLKATLEAAFRGCRSADVSVPVFVKLAPDLTQNALYQSMEAALQFPIAGFILTNTTIERPTSLQSPHRGETGGLSGAPLRPFSEQILAWASAFKAKHAPSIDLISVGGISTAQDVFLRLVMGATTTQLYSGLSIHGPYLPAQILTDLAHLFAVNDIEDCASLKGQIQDYDKARAYLREASSKLSKAL